MKTNDTSSKHTPTGFGQRSYPDIDLDFEKSKDDVWNALSVSMEKSNRPILNPKRTMIQMWVQVSAAAVVVLALGLGTFSALYTKTVVSATGQHYLALLPDGSSVEMNAGSILKYKPFWWYVSREVVFEGEAFFKVRKGETFEVVSQLGSTRVLGTSFNVYARKRDYRVTCYTGKVRVVSTGNGHALDIEPHEQASINQDGTMKLSRVELESEEAPWTQDLFYFTGTPMSLVFEEIERQYGISIKSSEDLRTLLYTGNFIRSLTVEEVLRMVCRPYGLGFKIIDGAYVVQKE